MSMKGMKARSTKKTSGVSVFISWPRLIWKKLSARKRAASVPTAPEKISLPSL
jgi:hypothetical protein